MKKFEVIMEEMGTDGRVRTLTQTAICGCKEHVVEWYGLNGPDILSYTITEITD